MKRLAMSLGLLLALLLLVIAYPNAGAADSSSGKYTPIAPASAIQASVQSQLKLVQDWLADKDYPSAAEAAVGLVTLVDLLGRHGCEAGWREKIAALRIASNNVMSAAKKKDAGECAKFVKECEQLLVDLAKEKPGDKAAVDDFKPFGATRTWMQLLDGAYADAKYSKSAAEVEQLAFTIADVANVVAWYRKEARWHDTALEVRDLAVGAASKAKAGNIDDARAGLKKAYQRCEFCHQGFKR